MEFNTKKELKESNKHLKFKKWLQEAVEYQHENFDQFFRKFKNRASMLSQHFTPESISTLQKDIKTIKKEGENECWSRVTNWADSAFYLLDSCKRRFQDMYLSLPEQAEFLLKKKYYEILSQYETSKTLFPMSYHVLRIDTSWYSYQELYDDVINLLKDPESVNYIKETCGEHVYQIIIKSMNNMNQFLSKIEKYKGLIKEFEREVLIWAKATSRRGADSLKEKMPDHEPFEYLYHASSNVPAILKEGFKTKKELGRPTGLGGGRDDLISFTANPKIAKAIASALRTAVRIAKGEITFEDIVNKYKRFNILSKEDIESNRKYSSDEKETAFHLYRFVLMRIQSKGLGYDPTFGFPVFDAFAKTNINDIGVIKAKVDMSKVKEYMPAEEEYRVPVDAISDVSAV